jgi:plasmid maintenance system antidote protein VapI
MVTPHTTLLQQVHEYVDAYIAYLGKGTTVATPEINAELHQIIRELESLQTHPDQAAEATRLSQRIGDQLAHLRMVSEQPPSQASPSRPQQTLAQAFRDYLQQEITYLARVSGGTRREQTNLLLGDIIADLKALALHPTDEQAIRLAADLEAKREQLANLQRPWQQMLDRP